MLVGLVVLSLAAGFTPTGGSPRRLGRAPAAGAPVVLYNAARGTTPDQQSLVYRAINGANPVLPAAATQIFAHGATTLDTTRQTSDFAGYAAKPPEVAQMPTLNRATGYALSFTMQIQQEQHAGSDRNGDTRDDRAGFSLTVISSDKRGIELGFWPDRVWAQNDGAAEPPHGTLFTHAEAAMFNTMSGLIPYTLTIVGDTYRLSSAGAPILSGSIRDYTAWTPPPPFNTNPQYNPYRTPNLIVLSDNSTAASAKIRLAYVGVQLREAVYLPFLRR